MLELRPPGTLAEAWRAWTIVAAGIAAGELPDVSWRNLGRWSRRKGDEAVWAVLHLHRFLDGGPVQDTPTVVLATYRHLLETDPERLAALLWLSVTQEVPDLGEPWTTEVRAKIESRTPKPAR